MKWNRRKFLEMKVEAPRLTKTSPSDIALGVIHRLPLGMKAQDRDLSP